MVDAIPGVQGSNTGSEPPLPAVPEFPAVAEPALPAALPELPALLLPFVSPEL